MTCRECLERYSDFLDDRMDAGERARYDAHLARCPACARYHRVVVNGLALVRTLPEIEPAVDFDERLRHRIYHVRDAAALESRSGSTRAVAALIAAALVSAAVWSPLLRDSPADGEAQRESVTVADQVGDWWYPAGSARAFPVIGGAPPSLSIAFPGPYSPLIVEPPVHDGPVGRAIFASHPHALE